MSIIHIPAEPKCFNLATLNLNLSNYIYVCYPTTLTLGHARQWLSCIRSIGSKLSRAEIGNYSRSRCRMLRYDCRIHRTNCRMLRYDCRMHRKNLSDACDIVFFCRMHPRKRIGCIWSLTFAIAFFLPGSKVVVVIKNFAIEKAKYIGNDFHCLPCALEKKEKTI